MHGGALMKARLGWFVAIAGAGSIALSAAAQGPSKLAVGPDAGGYLCPDGRQLYVKSCYDNSPDAKCGIVNMHLPAQNGFQRETTETRSKLTPSLAACKVYPLEFRNDGTVRLVVPKSAPPTQTAKAPAAPPPPKAGAKPVPPSAQGNAAAEARLAVLEGDQLLDEIGGDRAASDQRRAAALAAYARATKLDPTLREAWLRHAQIYADDFRPLDAIPSYEKAMELDPSDVETADALCLQYLFADLSSPAKGIAACQRLLKLGPFDPTFAHSAVARLQQQAGNNQKALVSALEWARLAPAESYPWRTLSEIYVALGRNTDALAAAHKAVNLEPKDWSLLALRGDVYRRLGKFTESIADYKAGIAAWPEGPELHYGLAVSLRAAGRKAEADAEQRLAIDHALSEGRKALKKPADGSSIPKSQIMVAKHFLEMLEKWDKSAAAKLAAEIKIAGG